MKWGKQKPGLTTEDLKDQMSGLGPALAAITPWRCSSHLACSSSPQPLPRHSAPCTQTGGLQRKTARFWGYSRGPMIRAKVSFRPLTLNCTSRSQQRARDNLVSSSLDQS
ncbi:hypothetical protein DPEC_G00270190 [Dallia pectoralis]|uniref:Uncharacterized protein n=1 Tax=Dallia pectoralis TaxID=75939 RepID=A0ACC2FPB6_DALPE|nr:hypothetical protein DPEC_G00270190 [Dallia pectoralis]